MSDIRQKPEGGDPINLLITRRISIHISEALSFTPITPNQVTVFAFLLLIGAGLAFMHGYWLLGIVLLPLYQLFDCVDGELARMTGKGTRYGKWLDNALDNIGWGIFLLLAGFHLPAFYVVAALFGYYVSTITYLCGVITFGQRSGMTDIKGKSAASIILSGIRGFSINVQMGIFMLGVLAEEMQLAFMAYALYANVFWIVRLFKYRRLT
jgi:phosphatidylglycerophosphate synthase